jgi:hypothetical protein
MKIRFCTVTPRRPVADLRSKLDASGDVGYCFGGGLFGFGLAVVLYIR